MVLSEVLIKPTETRQTLRSTFLYRKADCEGFKTYVEQVKEDFLVNASSKSVEELWSSFKSSINEGLKKFVPCKKIAVKRSLPWVTREIKRLIRKRDSLYKKLIFSKRSNIRKHFVNLRHLVKAVGSGWVLVLGNLQCLGVLLFGLYIVGQGPPVFAAGAEREGWLYCFSLIYLVFLFLLPFSAVTAWPDYNVVDWAVD